MSQILKIEDVLEFVKANRLYAGIERVPVTDYDMGNALEVVTAIGRIRNRDFAIDEENRFAYENFIRWCHADPAMQAIDPITGKVVQGDINRGIYIAGNTGSGKSWCLDVMLTYSRAWGFQVGLSEARAERSIVNLFWVTSRADAICQEYASTGDIAKFRSAPILGIQDLGQEPREVLYMGNRQNVLQQLLEYRGDCDAKLTLITSNLKISSERLRNDYGDRVQSRLCEMCNYLEIKGKDRRKKV